MCIEGISESYDDYEQYASSKPWVNSCLWNGREVSINAAGENIDNLSLLKIAQATQASFIIGNSPIGLCPLGHVAYHIYMQTYQPPIYLCNEIENKCPFELIRFQKWLHKEGK